MNYKRFRFLVVFVTLAFTSLDSYSQDRTLSAAAGDRYVISAKAGGVNFVEGRVSVGRKEGRSGYLTKGDTLNVGDSVSTADASKAEILLNPGSYLRLGDNTRFEFVTTALDDLQLKIGSGSAILEVFAADEFTVSISTPRSDYVLVQSGVYRIDVSSDEERLEVWKGAARLGGSQDLIKSGRAVTTVANAKAVVAKFDRDDKDSLDTWSKTRSKDLAKVASKLDRDQVRTSLMRSFLGRRWSVYDSFGLWVFNPIFGGYCFLPFGYGWNSPYGYGFGHYLGWYGLPPIVWYPPYYPAGTNTGQTTQPTRTRGRNQGFPRSATGSDRVGPAEGRSTVPPFVRMQQATGVGRSGFGDRGSFEPGSRSRSDASWFPTSTPSSLPTRVDSPPPPIKSGPVRQP